MKKIYLPSLLFFVISTATFAQTDSSAYENNTIQDTVQIIESRDSIAVEPTRVDTVVIEKVRVDTVYLPLKEEAKPPNQPQATETPKPKSKEKNDKVYYGGYATFSFGKYTAVGIEPLIAYKLFRKFSLGAKLSYEYVKNKNYDPPREVSNYGVAAFSRLRIAKRLYAHVEYSEMNYKFFDINGNSNREWISFLYVGGGVRLPMSKRVSLNAEILWDVLQEDNSPYKTVEPFVSVGIVAGF
ncbi:hypothetical protein [Carboxylicivirga sp. N1Y90]|uniref:hypothetical protein n=1 Tax=Carboxylicivirga fragile TaxID=3417571 RepID=UPI003D350CF7|nr:hypothetical protein [Marinilabiliaceae bacterium N1Y90]